MLHTTDVCDRCSFWFSQLSSLTVLLYALCTEWLLLECEKLAKPLQALGFFLNLCVCKTVLYTFVCLGEFGPHNHLQREVLLSSPFTDGES